MLRLLRRLRGLGLFLCLVWRFLISNLKSTGRRCSLLGYVFFLFLSFLFPPSSFLLPSSLFPLPSSLFPLPPPPSPPPLLTPLPPPNRSPSSLSKPLPPMDGKNMHTVIFVLLLLVPLLRRPIWRNILGLLRRMWWRRLGFW